MSFILDALKKLERQKQKESGASGADETVMEGGRRWGETRRRVFAGWGGVTLALAALIVAVLALYQSRSGDAPALTESEPAGPSPRPEAAEEESLPSTSPPAEGRDASDSEKVNNDRPTASQNMQEAVLEAPEEAEPEDAGSVPEEEIESAPPVRLVGSSAGELTRPEPISEDEDVSDEIPEGLPELVLQGTSVVGGRPIAVINYRRLFEGDLIEGARITKIADRIVELEYEGKRFVLKL
jgi:hypothetical protein